jgi:hypothetical protein
MDGLGNERPLLTIEVKMPLQLPPVCVTCGAETMHTTRIDVNAGDTATELKDALVGAIGFHLPRTVRVPCCKRCAGSLNRKTLLAFSMFPLGLGVFALVPLLSSIFGRLPDMVWMVMTFFGFMIALFGPILIYTRARNKTIPVHVSLIAGPGYRYMFFSRFFTSAFERSQPNMKHPVQPIGTSTSVVR